MNDICKCLNDECTIKETCYRWTSTPDEFWQSYSKFNTELKEECEYYWKTSNKVLKKK